MLPSATPTRQVRVDVAQCHAWHAKSRGVHGVNWDPSAPPEPAQCHKGLLLFPVAEMYFFRCGTFLGCKAAAGFLSCLGRFFSCLRRAFSCLGRFFPAASRMHFICCKGAFLLLQGVFSAALIFSRRSGIFCWRFPRCGNSFLPLQGVFFLLPNVFFCSDVFSCCEPVFFACCAETRS